MAYKRYFYRNGKKFGPYYYDSYRDETGKVRKKYVGTAGEEKIKLQKNTITPTILFVIAVLLILSSYFAFQKGATGKIVFLQEENLIINLKEGELLPINSKLVIEQNNSVKEFLLSEVIESNAEGNFYVENKELSGEGKGYGMEGKKISYPAINFKFKIFGAAEESEDVPEGNEETAENVTEEPEESVNETLEETEEIEQEENGTEETNPESIITGEVVSDEEIEGQVSKEKPFNYGVELENYDVEITEVDKGGINDLKISKENGSLTITTDYSETEKGFGKEYLTNETTSLEIGFDELGVEKEGLAVSLFYQDVLLDKISKEILEYENATSPTTEENITETNITTNETSGTTTRQYKAIINRPVKWIKFIDLNASEFRENLTIELPKQAENISVKTGQEVQDALQEVEEYEQIINEANREELVAGGITGDVSLEIKKGRGVLIRVWNWMIKITITGKVIQEQELAEKITEKEESKEIDLQEIAAQTPEGQDIAVEYYTDAPQAFEDAISENKKQIIISAPSELNYTDILAYTELQKEAAAEEVKLYHLTETGREEVNITKYDLNENNLTDYVEWIVPSLSNQTYELIIEISKAEHLDENRSFISDIYSDVFALDGNWSEAIENNEYVRVTFNQNLTNKNDITIYARASNFGNASAASEIIVYRENDTLEMARFRDITGENWYKVYLSNLPEEENTFDLKVVGGVEIDYIVDPVITIPNVALDAVMVNVTAQVNFTHLNLSVTAPYDKLLLYWSFDENVSATTIYDYTKYGRDGTIRNSAYTSSGKYAGAMEFPNAGNVTTASAALDPSVYNSNFSFGGWIKWYSIGKNAQGKDIPMGQAVNGNSYNDFYITNNSGSNVICWASTQVSGGYAISANTWYHVMCVRNTSTVRLYVNGVERDSIAGMGDYVANTPFKIGNVQGSYQFNGTLDEVMVLNKTLTAAEILAIYNNQSSRFAVSGTQEFANQSKLNISTGVNQVQVTGSYQANFGSSINLSVGYYAGGWAYTTPQVYDGDNTFTISTSSTNLTLNFTFYAGNDTNPFYSPILSSAINALTLNVTLNTSVTQCGTLDMANTEYTQQANIIPTASGACINITAQNITFNGNGYWIRNTTSSGAGVYSDQLNTTIKNCNVTIGGGGKGIELNRANSSYIFNNTLNNQTIGLNLVNISYTRIENNTANYCSSWAAFITGGNNNNLTGNNVSSGSYGFYISSSDNNILTNNKANYGSDVGITIIYSLNSILQNSEATNNYDYDSYGVSIQFSNNTQISNCNFSNNTADVSLTGINNTFLNTSYGSESVGSDSQLIRKWYYRAYVSNTAGTNLGSSNVTAFNRTGNYNFNLTTDMTGYTGLGEIIDYVNNGTITYYSPYNIYAIRTGYFGKNHSYNATLNQSEYRDIFKMSFDADVTGCGEILDQANTVYGLSISIAEDATSPCINITAENITFNGNGNYIDMGLTKNAIFSDQPNTTIKNCDIRNYGVDPSDYGIKLTGASSKLYNNRLNAGGTGMVLSTSDSRIENNTIIQNSYAGIDGSLSSSFLVNNTVDGFVSANHYEGMKISGSYNMIENNTITNTFAGDGLDLTGSYNNITNNYINNSLGDGIYLRGENNKAVSTNITSSLSQDVDSNSTSNIFLNCTYTTEAGSLTKKWYYRAYVNDTSGNNKSGINVTAFNVSSKYQLNLTTDTTGYTGLGEIVDYVNNGGTRTYYSLHNIYAGNSSWPYLNHSYNATSSASNYEDVFTFSESRIPLSAGWNMVGLTLHDTDTSTNKNVSIVQNWNLFGYSSATPMNVSDINFTNSTATVNWTKAVSQGKVLAYFYYRDNNVYRYSATPNLGMQDFALRQNRSYWAKIIEVCNSSQPCNLSFGGVGGSLAGRAYNWRDLRFTNGTLDLNVTEADAEGWVFTDTGDWSDYIVYRDTGWRTVCGSIATCTNTTLFSWEMGYWIWVNNNNVQLIRRN